MEIHVSVRQLVEFIMREGDIDNRRTGGSDTAMQEGGRIHRMIQRRMGSEYHAEVGLKYVWKTLDYDVIVEGRADGIIDRNMELRTGKLKENIRLGIEKEQNAQNEQFLENEMEQTFSEPSTDKVVIDEIKGTYKELKRITKPVQVHLSQAKCYAYIYASQNGLDNIGVRLTYCNIDTEQTKYFH